MIFQIDPNEWTDISSEFKDDQGGNIGIYAITNYRFVYFNWDGSAEGASSNVSSFFLLNNSFMPKGKSCGAGIDQNGAPLAGYTDGEYIYTSSYESYPCLYLTIIYEIEPQV